MEFRWNFALYMRAIGRHLHDEYNVNYTLCGTADTYGLSLVIPNCGEHIGDFAGNGRCRTLPRGNRRYRLKFITCEIFGPSNTGPAF